MFWNKKGTKDNVEEKLPKPGAIPGRVQTYLITEKKMDSNLVPVLLAAVRKSGASSSEIRIFDQADALANKVEVKDYTSLDSHPDLVLYEGTFDNDSKQVKLEQKKTFNYETRIYTENEIRQAIEALKDPGSTAFFYMASGTAHGGPLGMGAAVIELNPAYPGKKQKKYNCCTADVINMQPVGKGEKLFDSDKPKEIATWVKNSHRQRQYSS